MAYTFAVNNTNLTGGQNMYLLISTLMSVGWLKKMDSDGTTYSATGTQVTHGGTGTGGLGNTNAWVRIQSPPTNGGTIVNQTREFIIQRGSAGTAWRIKYSASALFTGGSPAAGVSSSSTDELWMVGAGTDASPTYNTLFVTDGGYLTHIVCGGAAENYSFVIWSSTLGQTGSTTNHAFALDVLQSGSYPALDVDPAVVYQNAGSAFLGVSTSAFPTSNQANPVQARAWMGATSAIQGATNGNNVNVNISSLGQLGSSQVNLYTNPWTNKDDLFPCLWGNKGATGPKGIKGFSTLFKMGSIYRISGETCDTVSPGSKDKICFNSIWLPWSGVAPII